MWIHREIEPLLSQRAATRPVVVLTGARQTGKTSLMRRLFPEHAFVTLDLPSGISEAPAWANTRVGGRAGTTTNDASPGKPVPNRQ